VTPFFDSLVKELSIPNVFSLQLCGADTRSSDESLPTMDGLLVYNLIFTCLVNILVLLMVLMNSFKNLMSGSQVNFCNLAVNIIQYSR